MKFAHITDSHLGGWRQPELQALNLESFKRSIDICIEEKVDFVLFTGDLFDSAFPSIEVLKETFFAFRKLKDAKIKSYLIAGSHDFSVSGKTFLDVLENAGFCEICDFEDRENEIILKPIKHETFYIYGYPGKKSGLEVPDLRKIKILEPYESNFRILMLHTTVTEITQNLPVDSVSLSKLPRADYYALGHVHIDFFEYVGEKPAVYAGPTFPNNFKELEDLKYGSFYIVEVGGFTKVTKKEIKIKEPILIEVEIENALNGTQKILSELKKRELKDKIVLLRVYGTIKKGKASDIKYQEIDDYVNKMGAYSFLKNTSQLEIEKKEIDIEINQKDMDKIEEVLIKKYEKENPSDLNLMILPLMDALNLEKQEDEKSATFESRLFSELGKVLGIEL